MITAAFIVAVLPFSAIFVEREAPAAGVQVRVTQKYLVPVCLDERPVDSGERSWRLAAGSHSFAFTMRNEPRNTVTDSEDVPGMAVVRFVLEAEHKYEVEIRAPATTFSSRVWKSGEWKPVVRDRTADRIVSSEPEWPSSGCEP